MTTKTQHQYADKVFVKANKWFDEKWGNTYFAVEITARFGSRSKMVVAEKELGYDDHYKHRAVEMAVEKGWLPPRKHYDNGMREPLHVYRDRTGIEVYFDMRHVDREVDLTDFTAGR